VVAARRALRRGDGFLDGDGGQGRRSPIQSGLRVLTTNSATETVTV
jgi:hypothetical protein